MILKRENGEANLFMGYSILTLLGLTRVKIIKFSPSESASVFFGKINK